MSQQGDDYLRGEVTRLRDRLHTVAEDVAGLKHRETETLRLLKETAAQVNTMSRADEQAAAVAAALGKRRGALFSRFEKSILILLAAPGLANLILRLLGIEGNM